MLALILAAALAAVDVKPAAGPIEIDGVLDEAAWAAAAPIALPFEWFPSDAPAPVATEAFVTFDDRRLYVAFRAHDPEPARIRARYHQRDDAASDDTVGFLLDPFNDDRRAYQFRVNPLGVQMDAVNSDVEGTEDFAWDAVWDSAGRITADGYVVEVAIPLAQLRVPAGSTPATWGFMATRDWPRDIRHRVRSIPTDQDRACLVCQFGDLRGVQAATSGRGVELTPTLTGSLGQVRGSDGGFETDADDVEPGLNAKWSVTPATTLQATLNPDFSQVESDAEQLDVNTRFAVFYPEKRPFFLEGADLFETQIPLAFTRNVASPSAGVKLTGKAGRNTYGLLVARDRTTNVLLPGAETDELLALDGDSTNVLARYRRDVGEASSVGVFSSVRTGADYSGVVVSADAYQRIGESNNLRVQLAGSRTDDPSAAGTGHAGAFSGHGLLARYTRVDRDWEVGARYHHYAPGFRADAGFLPQVGVRKADVFVQRRFRGGPDRWFSNLWVFAGTDGTREWNGAWSEWGADVGVVYNGPRQSSVELVLAPNQEYYRGATYHNFRQGLIGSVQLGPDVEVSVDVSHGGSIDFTNARQARTFVVSPAASLRLGRRLEAQLGYKRQALDTRNGERIFTLHLPRVRALFHLNERAFVRGIYQWRGVDRNVVLFDDAAEREERELQSQLLFSYRLDAQTVVLLGYSDIHEGSFLVPRRQTGRALFAKLSYAFLF